MGKFGHESVGYIMAWEPFELADRTGEPLSNDDRSIILRALEAAIRSSDISLEKLLTVAQHIGLNITHIRDLSAYSKRAFARILKDQKVAAARQAILLESLQPHHMDSRSDLSSVPPVEYQILLCQLLDTLNGLDREIYLARLKGHAFAKIDEALSLKAGTSESRYREAARRFTR
jgi:hypothetical protein